MQNKLGEMTEENEHKILAVKPGIPKCIWGNIRQDLKKENVKWIHVAHSRDVEDTAINVRIKGGEFLG
jgi:hypothetical protein